MTERLSAREAIALVTEDFAPLTTPVAAGRAGRGAAAQTADGFTQPTPRPAADWADREAAAQTADDFTGPASPPASSRDAREDWSPEDEAPAAGARATADDWRPEDDAAGPRRVDGADGPLGWPGYDAARARAAAATGEDESVLYGTATVAGRPCVLVVFEFGFLGGSLGRAAGDRLVAAYASAAERRLPLVSLVATGGSRMQEGMIALAQLQRVAAAAVALRAAGVAHVTVLRDPSTGGGWATVGAGADVVLALPSAQIAFAGSRVRPRDADPSAYTAEDQHAHGHVDALVPPERLRETLGRWLRLLGAVGGGASGPAAGSAGDAQGGPVPPPPALGPLGLPATGWDAVRRARGTERPRAGAYLDAYFTERAAIRGDRAGGVDPGVECGFGVHDGRVVAYAAQDGGATRPAGFRTVARLVRLAGRLGIPVLTLIDTPGAANDAAAERAGAGPAIAEAFTAIAEAPVPVTSLLVGEGGSGGALALAAPGNTWAAPGGYFSVIAPELAAQILKRTPDQVPETAEQLRLRPQDLVELGVVRGIVGGGAVGGATGGLG